MPSDVLDRDVYDSAASRGGCALSIAASLRVPPRLERALVPFGASADKSVS
jgi:hypothetical protein